MTAISDQLRTRALDAAQPRSLGTIVELAGLHLLVAGLPVAVGDLVEVLHSPASLLAEVVALRPEGAVCLPLGTLNGVRIGDHVRHTGGPLKVMVGEALRGRVLDGLGRPIDGGPPLEGLGLEPVTVDAGAPNALQRPRITEPLGLGVRALDALVPCGRGQRIGIMAGSGVGKSSLLSMIARGTEAEVSVISVRKPVATSSRAAGSATRPRHSARATSTVPPGRTSRRPCSTYSMTDCGSASMKTMS